MSDTASISWIGQGLERTKWTKKGSLTS